jgi:hypothetical protein
MLTFRGRRHPPRRLRLARGEPGRHRRLSTAGVRGPDPAGNKLLGRIHEPRPPAPQSRAPFPLATAPPTGTSLQSHTSPTISAAATGTRKAPSATSPSSPTLPTSSKLPHFLQSWLTATALKVALSRPPAELRRTPLAPPPPLTPASASGRRSATRFLGCWARTRTRTLKYSSVNASAMPSAGRGPHDGPIPPPRPRRRTSSCPPLRRLRMRLRACVQVGPIFICVYSAVV